VIVFVVIVQDRHTDDALTVYATRELADAHVEDTIRDYGAGDVKQYATGPGAPWCRYVYLTDEGDHVRIEEHEVIEPLTVIW
jgi:hypothetical protein